MKQRRIVVVMSLALLLPACGKKPEAGTEIGQGGSVVTGSAGPAGAQGAARELLHCDAPVATLALAENPNGYTMHGSHQLPASPVPLVRLLAQQSGCFRVVDRAAGPFGSFNAEMRRQADQIAVVSRFKFTRDQTLETSVQ